MRFLSFSLLIVLWSLLAFGQAFTPRRPFVYALASAPASPTNLTAGLYAWYTFDTTSNGIVKDDWTNHFDGGQAGPAPQTTNGSPQGGQYVSGAAAGPGGRVIITNLSSLDFTNVTITWLAICGVAYNNGAIRPMWQLLQTSGSHYGVSCQAFSDNNWYIGWLVSAGDKRLTFPVTAGNWCNGAWKFYAYAWTATNQLFYTNAVLCFSNSTAPVRINANGSLLMMAQSAGTEFGWNTISFDDFRVYTNTLTANDLSYIYHTYYGVP